MVTDDQRERLNQYLMAQQDRRAKLEGMQADRQQQMESSNNLAALLMNSAAQAGSINGKMADASPVENYAKAENAQTRSAMDRSMEQGQGRDAMRAKLYEQLQAKREQQTGDQVDAKYRSDTLAQTDRIAREKAARDEANAKADRALSYAKLAGEKEKGDEKPPSAEQLGSANFGRKAQDADAVIESIEGEGYDPSSYGRSARDLPLVGALTRSQDDRKYIQAQKEFIAAILRKESGGAITPAEFSEYGAIYFPQAGDGKDVMAQKKAARKAASDNLIAMSGKASGQIANRPPPVPAKPESGTATAAPGGAGLQAGTVENGYRFKGGDPADEKNWEPE